MKQYKIKVNGNPYDVTVFSVDGNGLARLSVNGVEHTVEIVPVVKEEQSESAAPLISVRNEAKATAAVSAGETVVSSPLPGVIIGISVKAGDKVAAGQTLATLEAMKMENAIEAEVSGTVKAVHVQIGESVLEGAKIVTIDCR